MAQEPEVPPDALIRLQRTSCFGSCPIYTVTIDARGTVTFDGERFVRVVGRKTMQISTSTVATLLARAERIRFFEMRDAYRVIENPDGTVGMVTDLPTKFVTVTVNGRTKRVEDYVAAPDSLAEFEREIDAAAGTKRWVFLDEDALEELTRSGWLGSSEEGATLLRQAIERDDVPIARRLIELGSDLDGPPNNRLPPLIAARSSSMVNLLVKAGANPNERPIGGVAARTPLMTTSYKDASVAEALLKAGARRRGHGRWAYRALVRRVCGQLARGDGATRRRSKSSGIDGESPPPTARGKRARAKSVRAVQFSIVGGQPLKTLTECLRCWQTRKSRLNVSRTTEPRLKQDTAGGRWKGS